MSKKMLNEACINIMLSDLSDNDKEECLLELISEMVNDIETLEIVKEHLQFLNITEE